MNTSRIPQRKRMPVAHYFSIFDNSIDHCYMLDTALQIVYYNKNASLIGAPFIHNVALNYRRKAEELLNDALIRNQSSGVYLEIYETQNTCTKFSVTASPVDAEDGSYCLLICQKLEGLREQNMELEQKNEYLKDFVYNATHDLRSPLSVLKSFVDLIRRFDDEGKREMALAQMKEAALSLEHKLAGMSDLVTMDEHDLRPANELSFQGVYTQAKYLLMNEIEEAKPEFNVDFDVDEINYIGAHLLSIIQNLLSNSIKYRQAGQPLRVDISTRRAGDFIVLSVTDNGIGMDLENYGHKLFKPFQRLTSEVKGTGIGLSMIHNWLSRSGGRIEVESKTGAGSTFKVFLKPMPVASVDLEQ